MTYGTQPTRREILLAQQVWDVMFQALEADRQLSLDEIVDEARIAPHLPMGSRRAYANTGIHWVRMALQYRQRMALVCDRSTALYRLTADPNECRVYYHALSSVALTVLRTAQKSLVGDSRATRLARRTVARCIEDLTEELAEVGTP